MLGALRTFKPCHDHSPKISSLHLKSMKADLSILMCPIQICKISLGFNRVQMKCCPGEVYYQVRYNFGLCTLGCPWPLFVEIHQGTASLSPISCIFELGISNGQIHRTDFGVQLRYVGTVVRARLATIAENSLLKPGKKQGAKSQNVPLISLTTVSSTTFFFASLDFQVRLTTSSQKKTQFCENCPCVQQPV